MDFLAGNFLADEVGQQARGQAAVLGLFADQQGGGTDRQLVQFLGAGAVVQAGDGARSHPHRVHSMQAFAATLDGADNLVEVYRLGAAIALGHAHGGGGRRRGQFKTGFSRSDVSMSGSHDDGVLANVMHAAPARAGSRAGTEQRAWKDGVAAAATAHDPGSAAATAPRHQPSSPRRHRSRHHAVCIAWLSAGLRTHGQEGGGLLLLRRFPRRLPQCCWRGRSQLPLRGSAGLALKASPASLLIRRKNPARTDGAQDSGGV